MKKIVSLFLGLLILCGMTTAFAVDGEFWFTVGEFKFNIWSEGEVHLSVAGYIGNDAEVVVPDKLSVEDILAAKWDPWAEQAVINDVKACGEFVPVAMLYSFGEDFFLNPDSVKRLTVPETVEINLTVDYDFVGGELVGVPGNIFANCPGIEIVGASEEIYRIAEEKGFEWKKGSASEPETNEITVLINGSKVEFDQKPVIIEDRTLVPLRAIFEGLGAEVLWDGDTQTVTAIKDNTKITLQIGSAEMYIGSDIKALDVPAMLLGGRTMVPVRAVSEAFGCAVNWVEATQTVVIIK